MRVVWFFGPSAAGKKTLLYQLTSLQNRRHQLAIELGLGSQDLVLPVVIPNRIRGKRGEEYQKLLDTRIRLITQIYGAEIDAVWLIHGQGIDIAADVLGHIKQVSKCALSLAIYLHVDKQTYQSRAAARGISRSYKQAYASAEKEILYLRSRFQKVLVWQHTLDSEQARTADLF
jgi:hypothetical protein